MNNAAALDIDIDNDDEEEEEEDDAIPAMCGLSTTASPELLFGLDEEEGKSMVGVK